jgi:hypothetical protein
MSDLKTTKNTTSVEEFIRSISDTQRREDCVVLNTLLKKITGENGAMWGSSIVGYGTYSYTRSDNKFYEYMAVGFSPRVQALTIYNIPGYESSQELMSKLGTYKNGKSCLYVKKLADIDLGILETILSNGYTSIAGKHLDYKTGAWTEMKKS